MPHHTAHRTANQPPVAEVPTPRDYLRRLKLHDLPEMVSVTQICDLLGISRQLAHRLIERGDLASIRLGPHTVRVFRASLEDYLRRNVAD